MQHRAEPDEATQPPGAHVAHGLCLCQQEPLERTFLLRPGLNRLGTERGNEVRLEGHGISRHHAEIVVGRQRVVVTDLASKNGTHVSGRAVARATLQLGDELRVGSLRLRLQAAPEAQRVLFNAESWSRESQLSGRGDNGAPQDSSTLSADCDQDRDEWLATAQIADALLEEADPGLALERLCRWPAVRGALLVETCQEGRRSVLALAGEIELDDTLLASDGAHGNAAGPVYEPGDEANNCRTYLAELEHTRQQVVWQLRLRAREDLGAFAQVLPVLLRILALGTSQGDELGPGGAAGEDAATAGSGFDSSQALQFPSGFVVGCSAAARRTYAQLQLLAPTQLPVLILGETGVGKEQIARTLHASGPRRDGPFVAVNCAAIPAELLEAELFGIAPGVATGVHSRTGSFQHAQGGTLLLDEVGEMPRSLQAKLLRVLQEREVQPVGARPHPIDVRILAATNLDLRERVSRGEFRADLYYRLSGAEVELPALRNCREDVPHLLTTLLRRACRELGKQIRGISLEAMQILASYSWPGNVRELEHEARRLALRCPAGQPVLLEAVSPALRQAQQQDPLPDLPELEASLDLASLEARTVREALQRAGGRRLVAAKLLGISRFRLRRLMERHSLEAESSER